MPTSICSFIASKPARDAAAAAAAPPVIVYNPFDEDAVVNYFLIFRKQLAVKDRKKAMIDAITYLLKNGVRPMAVKRRLNVYWAAVSLVNTELGRPAAARTTQDKVTLGVERRAETPQYTGGAKHSETAGYTPMSFDLAERIRADPIANCAEIARKYGVSTAMARTIKKTTSWTRPAAAV